MSAQPMALWEPERQEYKRLTMAEVRAIPWNGLTAVGSFSGCGGSSLGLRMAGWRVPYVIEFIPAAADSYEANAPSTVVDRRDIREVKGAEILERLGIKRGELDLFEGSPPCASFSMAGSREKAWGHEKSYSDSQQRTDDLFWEWARLVDDLQPRAFVAENVPGLLAGNALTEYAHKITRRLGDLGYLVDARVLNAANYGVPQARRRLIFIGYRQDLSLRPLFPSPMEGEPFTLRQALADVIEDDPADVEASAMGKFAVGRAWEFYRRFGNVNDGAGTGVACARCGRMADAHQDVKRNEKGRVTTMTCPTDGKPGDPIVLYFMLTVPDLNRPCPTLTATGAQAGAAAVCHPMECRKFTPAEAKAICGFPADFILTGSREQRYERMGRAVPPPLYAAVGRQIAEALLSVV